MKRWSVAPINPADLGACFWIDPKDATTLDETGGVITSITDKISGNVFTQTTSGNRPSLVEVDGYNCIRFAGSQWIPCSSVSGVAATTSYLLAAVFKASSTGNLPIFAFRGSGDAIARQFGTRNADRIYSFSTAAVSAYADIASNAVKLLAVGRKQPDVPKMTIWVNGVNVTDAIGGDLVTVEAATTAVLGAYTLAGAAPWVGDLHELVLIQDDASDETRMALEAYLTASNGL